MSRPTRTAADDTVPDHRTTWPAARALSVFVVTVLVLEALVFALRLGGTVTPFVLVVIPAAAAVAVRWISDGPGGVRILLGRLVVWRVDARWYLVALGIPITEKLVVDGAGILLGLTTPDRVLGGLSMSALVVPVVVVLPAMLEELGWRGFGAQTALDAGRSPAWAGLVIGLAFLTMHLPLYLPGHLYDGLPVWPSVLILLSSSVLLTWIYVHTSSALLAGLMHAAFNATVPLTWGLDPAWVWQARAITLAILAGAILLSRPFRSTGQPGEQPFTTEGVRP
ncbi:MAG TPA: CPBP family intramembrane glutamic endopeptidase [Microlunatus sp.]